MQTSFPMNMVNTIQTQLVATGKVVRGYLGVRIQELTEELAEQLGYETTKGVVVTQVEPNSPASMAGIRRSRYAHPAGESSGSSQRAGLPGRRDPDRPDETRLITLVQDQQATRYIALRLAA